MRVMVCKFVRCVCELSQIISGGSLTPIPDKWSRHQQGLTLTALLTTLVAALAALLAALTGLLLLLPRLLLAAAALLLIGARIALLLLARLLVGILIHY